MPDIDTKPVVYIFHGDDPVAIERHVADMVAHMGDPGMAELNISHLDGKQASEQDLRTAALSLPFLAARRLVILRNSLARLDKRNKVEQERLLALLDELPPSTALVLPIEDSMERGDWRLVPTEKHWLRAWVNKAGKRALLRECTLPSLMAMPDWVLKQAEALGGRFSSAAAKALVDQLGNDTQFALQEIRKLLEYANYQRPVEPEDVELLTAATAQASVFEMVDALAEGNASKAQRLLSILMESVEKEQLFAMVIRQFRLLIQAREALDEGLSLEQVGREMGQKHLFVTRKMVGQAQRFTLPRLEALYHQLLDIDEAAKTSQMSLDTALNLLVVDVGR